MGVAAGGKTKIGRSRLSWNGGVIKAMENQSARGKLETETSDVVSLA